MPELLSASPRHDAAILQLVAARDRVDYGEDLTREPLLSLWRHREDNPAADSVVAQDRERGLVGYALIVQSAVLAFVDPRFQGRGVGTLLEAWSERRGREFGRSHVYQRVADKNLHAQRLLSDAGYDKVRSVRRLSLTLARQIAPAPLPADIVLRELDPDRDAEAVHAADARAFADNADYPGPRPLADFYEAHLSRPAADRPLSTVAWRGEEVAAFAVCHRQPDRVGFIDLLAVDPMHRRRGLGNALLTNRFAAFADAGLTHVRLDVASDNPSALALYERAGMTTRYEGLVYEKWLTGAPGSIDGA